ncbi:hypothetical protein H6802_04445 [Candidatus Nomurabacteria bacterium]|uniref:Uncharacterized protein n=1 Tax=candidate division WWE3 bacterium TaxID=2053526 RepID=A0A955E0F3_UNCKA|nr:hypothetical protein [candidate division WWE3 bacterium]MCB9824169.1 hypothetical protein [Candidatus Nomurabacteria bacterium]MCB9826860.1 hypothetical protein [Candidatus Nomurabacteria bacterium]MCB9828110.1 hypothetical protein [Candidatus Nomurabacteria bacterium]HXK52446.1 hypothetical protein [bacterium]
MTDEQLKRLVLAIIKKQTQIIGENLALERAVNTGLIQISSKDARNLTIEQIHFSGADNEVVTRLIESYREIFGQASVDVCVNILRENFPNDFRTVIPQTLLV